MKSTFDIIGTIYYNNKWKTYITYMKGDLIMTLDEIKVVGIAGAGTMGASMAQIFAQYGYTVIIYDAFEAGLERGKHLVEINQASLVEAGDITAEQSAVIKTKLSFTGDINGLKDCDIIVESVLERLDVKQDFWVRQKLLYPLTVSLLLTHPVFLSTRSSLTAKIRQELAVCIGSTHLTSFL